MNKVELEMYNIRVGCKKYPESSSSFDFILVKGGSKTYKAFDIPVADEGEGGKEEINTVCPHCGDNLKIEFHRAHTNKIRRNFKIFLVVFFSIIYFPLMYSLVKSTPINTTTDFLSFFLFAGIFALLFGGAFIIGWKIGFPKRTQGGKHNLHFEGLYTFNRDHLLRIEANGKIYKMFKIG